MGSGLNCLAYRIARGQKWSGGRSQCPACGHVLSWRDLVPLVSWLALRGKCRYCREPISPRYPIAELSLAICYTAILFRFGLTLQTLACEVLCSCLFCLTLVDLDIQIIPDRFLIIPACVRLAQLLYERTLPQVGLTLLTAIGFGGAVLLLCLFMDKILKKESMGGGDLKLLFLLGLFFDLPCCLLLLILACLVGLGVAWLTVRAQKSTPFPFGPAISIAAFLTLLVGEPITNWYLSLFLS